MFGAFAPLGLLLLGALNLPACGAHTGLAVDVCCDASATRIWETLCGEGMQVCEGQGWSECEVPPTEFVCTDVCGVGVRLCENGQMGVCTVPRIERLCSSPCGEGVHVCENGQLGPCSADVPLPPELTVVVRDFRRAHPDFEAAIGNDRGFVETLLGPGNTPVYVGPSATTHGQVFFDQWFADVPGINQRASLVLRLEAPPDAPGHFVFDERGFPPNRRPPFWERGGTP